MKITEYDLEIAKKIGECVSTLAKQIGIKEEMIIVAADSKGYVNVRMGDINIYKLDCEDVFTVRVNKKDEGYQE